MSMPDSAIADQAALDLDQYRSALVGYCYRMLGSSFDAEDAVQETMTRAWRAWDRFEGRSSAKTWLFKIASNVCFDMLAAGKKRALPMDLGEPGTVADTLVSLPGSSWLEPIPDGLLGLDDPADRAIARESVRLAFMAALQHLPPRQRAVLVLRDVLSWKAAEVAGLLETSVASVNSALQRARATLADRDLGSATANLPDPELVDRYVAAFESYDMESLVAVIAEDATQSMPPYDFWLRGRDAILEFWSGPGIECRGSRLVPVEANAGVAFGQYRPSGPNGDFRPWALQILEYEGDSIVEMTFFLNTERVFPLFGLPDRLD